MTSERLDKELKRLIKDLKEADQQDQGSLPIVQLATLTGTTEFLAKFVQCFRRSIGKVWRFS